MSANDIFDIFRLYCLYIFVVSLFLYPLSSPDIRPSFLQVPLPECQPKSLASDELAREPSKEELVRANYNDDDRIMIMVAMIIVMIM